MLPKSYVDVANPGTPGRLFTFSTNVKKFVFSQLFLYCNNNWRPSISIKQRQSEENRFLTLSAAVRKCSKVCRTMWPKALDPDRTDCTQPDGSAGVCNMCTETWICEGTSSANGPNSELGLLPHQHWLPVNFWHRVVTIATISWLVVHIPNLKLLWLCVTFKCPICISQVSAVCL